MIFLENPPPSFELCHESLVTCLRAEIEELGGLVALFEKEQTAILARNSDEVLEIAGKIEKQALATRARRKEREAVIQSISPVENEQRLTINDLIPLLREPVRPLVQALKEEISRLINHTRRRALQNQALLSRTFETSGDMVRRPQRDLEPALNLRSGLGSRDRLGTGKLFPRS